MQLDKIVEGVVKYLTMVEKLDLMEAVGRALVLKAEKSKNKVVVETATLLEEKMRLEIEKVVGKAEFIVNKGLIGGMKITRGDQLIDLSVRQRLEEVYAA